MCANCTMYKYVMEELLHEEYALADQPRWYEGAIDGNTWIIRMAATLLVRYYDN